MQLQTSRAGSEKYILGIIAAPNPREIGSCIIRDHGWQLEEAMWKKSKCMCNRATRAMQTYSITVTNCVLEQMYIDF